MRSLLYNDIDEVLCRDCTPPHLIRFSSASHPLLAHYEYHTSGVLTVENRLGVREGQRAALLRAKKLLIKKRTRHAREARAQAI